jgi:hypothetical protein
VQRYHPDTTRLTPQGTSFKIANQRALPHCLTAAIHATFDTICGLFASPLNSSMNPNVNYCATPQEDVIFGAQDQAYSYRWTGSCLVVPEHEPADTIKAVLHALACSTSTESPLLVVMILTAWEDAPWRTRSILSHPNVTTIVQLKPNHLKFIPVSEQLDTNLDMTLLRATDHPIDVVVIADKEDKGAYLHPTRLQHILIPVILQACQDTTQTIFVSQPRPRMHSHQRHHYHPPPSDRSPTPAYTLRHNTHYNPVAHLHTSPPL